MPKVIQSLLTHERRQTLGLVTLQGVTGVEASMTVILRLFRVVKIVDELVIAVDEKMKDLEQWLTFVRIESMELRIGMR